MRINGRFKQLLLNVGSASGSIRVAVLDGDQPVPGLDLQSCRPVSTDGLRLPVVWQDASHTEQTLAGLEGKLVRLEFRIQGASLFAFEFRIQALEK